MSLVWLRGGRITLPLELRRALGLRPRDPIAFVQRGDAIVLQPLRGASAALPPGRVVPFPRPLLSDAPHTPADGSSPAQEADAGEAAAPRR